MESLILPIVYNIVATLGGGTLFFIEIIFNALFFIFYMEEEPVFLIEGGTLFLLKLISFVFTSGGGANTN